MKKIFLLIAAAGLFTSCGAKVQLSVELTNLISVERTNETVEVPWSAIQARFGSIDPQSIVVLNSKGEFQTSQVLYKGNTAPQSVIFQANVAAKGKAAYTITKGKAKLNANAKKKVFGRFVPERKDDFAWENNRMAYRIYGPALMATDGPSNGIDVWCKRTEELVINKWYKKDLSKQGSYHKDDGEGVDCYKVGRTLGCGALAPYIADTLVLGNNFAQYSIIDQGPIRITFDLQYAPLDVAGNSVTEVRRISLDANTNLNQITETFTGGKTMPVAAGIVLKTAKATPAKDITEANATYKPVLMLDDGYVTYAEQADALKTDSTNNGIIYTAIVVPFGLKEVKVQKNHVLAIGKYVEHTTFTYYTGAGWSKNGFATEKDWQNYVANEAFKLRMPLQLNLK